MENYSAASQTSNLPLDDRSIDFLRETARWAYFLSIVGFVSVGLLILVGLFIGTIFSGLNSSMGTMLPMKLLSFIYIVIAAIYIMPILSTYRFAVHMKFALRENDKENLTTAFGNLKSLFRFMGIMTIVVLSIYLIVFISAIVFGIIGSF